MGFWVWLQTINHTSSIIVTLLNHLKKKKKNPGFSNNLRFFYVDVAVVVVVVGFKVFKERNVGNNRLLLSELRHLKNGPAMVFWSMFDLTRAAPANTPRPVASWVKTIRPIFDLLDHEPEREREREREREEEEEEEEAKIFFLFFWVVLILFIFWNWTRSWLCVWWF